MSFDDELLLTTLGGALETRAAQPSSTELAEFRAMVTGAGLGEVLPFPEPVAPRRRQTALVAAAVIALLAFIGAGVLAAGQPLPNSLRSPVRALGFPVDDAAVARTRTAMAELRSALEGTDDARIEAATVVLVGRLRSLSGADFAAVAAEARALLQVAQARLDGGLGRVHSDSEVTPPTVAAVPPVAEGDTGGASSSDGSQVGTGGGEVEAPEVEAPEDSSGSSDDVESESVDRESVDSSSPHA